MQSAQKAGQGMKNLEIYALLGQVGFILAVPIVAGAILGKMLDDRFGTSPWFLLALIFLGMVIGGYGVYRLIIQAEQLDK